MFLWVFNIVHKNFSVSRFFPAYYLQSLFSSKEGGLSAIFDSQIENVLSQVVQRLNATETDFCWQSTQ